MDHEALHYFPLAAAVLASIVALLQARRMKQLRPKSHKLLSRGVIGMAVAFGGGLFVANESFELIVGGLAILSIAFGLVVFGKELKVIGAIIREQRVDFVTGIYNRRIFDERLFGEHSRTKRTAIGYAVAVFEIDDYDELSDSDKINGVKLLAKTMRSSVRHTDTLARISDHQIAVLMVDTRADGAIIGVERARERFFFRSCGHDEEAHVTRPLTTSVGIAAFDDDIVDEQDVVRNAEQALHRMRAERGVGVRVFRRNDHRAADAMKPAA